MSEITAGFWISPDGDFLPVYDHISAVEDAPKIFGLTAKDVARVGVIGAKTLAEWREKILIRVMKNEWIRVRGHREYTTFEGWGFNDWFLARVRMFLKKRNYWPTDNIAISDVSRSKFAEVSVEAIMSDRADTWTFNPKKKRRSKDKYPDIGRRE